MATGSDPRSGNGKYYDAAEVEAYVKDVTETIRALRVRLREANSQAEAAQRLRLDSPADSEGIGDLARQTIAEADSRAAGIIHLAEMRAVEIEKAAEAEARRLIDEAGDSAARTFMGGEARLLAAINAFREGTDVLRTAFDELEADATDWRRAHTSWPDEPG